MDYSKSNSILLKFNVKTWDQYQYQWNDFLSFAQPEEKKRILRYRFHIDAKRSLLGHLAARSCISDMSDYNIAPSTILLSRTKENKPFLSHPRSIRSFDSSSQKNSHLDFNISHSGDWVLVAAHTQCQVGVDVEQISRPKMNVERMIHDLKPTFLPSEVQVMEEVESHSEQMKRLLAHWVAKEAFIKAIGMGVGFGLERIEIWFPNTHDLCAGEPRLIIDGNERRDWVLRVSMIDDNHIAAVAWTSCHNDCSGWIENNKETLRNQWFETAKLVIKKGEFKILKS